MKSYPETLFIYLLATLLLLIILRDLLFRLLFIYPKTHINGWYARNIEQDAIKKIVSIQFKREKWDVIFIGNSHVMDAIDPNIIFSISKKKAFNLCYYYLPIPNMIELCIKERIIAPVIFIDISTRYSTYSENYKEVFNFSHYHNIDITKERILNSLSFFIPSLFIPKQYFFLIPRSIKKIKLLLKKRISIGRYMPFKWLIGYYWSLDIRTNHRMAIRKSPKSRSEKYFELMTLRKSIHETKNMCNKDSPLYYKSIKIIREYLELAKKNKAYVLIIRLPLDKRMIDYENRYYSFYFKDIKNLASEMGFVYIDINDSPIYDSLNFYSDGQHLDHQSAVKLTTYLCKEYILC
jgi:hypothetical protein